MIKDVMPPFELFQPMTVDEALALLDEHGAEAWVVAGGLDSYDWFKDRAMRPAVVVDLSQVSELRGIRSTADGIEIGAMTTLTEIATHPDIVANYGVLAEAAAKVATPQIRNQGTIGGNLAQDCRCWYYRDGLPCYRAGGNTCYADTPVAVNREHALFDADRCVAVTISDTAPAMVVLDAKFVIRPARGDEIVVDAQDFFIGPDIDIERMTILRPTDLLTTIRIPNTWAGSQFYFEKVTDRRAWDFALVNVASAIKVSGGMVEDIRVAMGGVSCTPRRLEVVEDIMRGQAQNEENAALAGTTSIRGAIPLNFNHFKVPLMKNLVMRAVRSA